MFACKYSKMERMPAENVANGCAVIKIDKETTKSLKRDSEWMELREIEKVKLDKIHLFNDEYFLQPFDALDIFFPITTVAM